MFAKSLARVAAAVVLLSAFARAGELVPERSWQAARDKAAAEKKPILLCILNDAEVACRRMEEKTYPDSEVQAKLAGFVLLVSSLDKHAVVALERDGALVDGCARYPGLLCAEHQAIEKEMRPQFADATGLVIVPQHAIFGSDGKLLVKRPYLMKRSGFLEFLDGGLSLAGAGGATATRSAAVERQLKAVLDARDDTAREKAMADLLSDSSPDRQSAFFELLGRFKDAASRGALVRVAGRPQFQPWAPAIASLLEEKERFVRNCAVVTLEEERAGAVVEDLLALWATEKDAEIRKDLLRALGPCGNGNEAAKKLLLEELNGTKESHRVAAALSLGSFVKGNADVVAALEARWKKDKGQPARAAILWGLGESGDEAQASRIESLAAGSKDDDLMKIGLVAKERLYKPDVQAAAKVLGKGGGKEARRLLGVLFDDDKVVRNAIRDADYKISGKH